MVESFEFPFYNHVSEFQFMIASSPFHDEIEKECGIIDLMFYFVVRYIMMNQSLRHLPE